MPMRHSHDDQMRAAGLVMASSEPLCGPAAHVKPKNPSPKEVISINRDLLARATLSRELINRASAIRPAHLAWRSRTAGGVRGLVKLSRSLKL